MYSSTVAASSSEIIHSPVGPFAGRDRAHDEYVVLGPQLTDFRVSVFVGLSFIQEFSTNLG